MGNTEDVLAVSDLRAEGNGGLFLWGLGLFWWLKTGCLEQSTTTHAWKDGLDAAIAEAGRTIFNGQV